MFWDVFGRVGTFWDIKGMLFEAILTLSDPYEPIWSYLELLGSIQINLELFIAIYSYLKPIVAIWSHLGQLGAI